MPESPRWLVKMNREEEARYILGRLRGETGNDFGKAEAEFQDVRNISKLERDTSHQQSYFAMFFGIGAGKLHTARRVQLVIWLQILQEWIGIAGVTLYGPTIFQLAGIGPKDRLWVSGLNDITYMVCRYFRSLSWISTDCSSSPPSFACLPSIALVVVGLSTGVPSVKAFAVSPLVASLVPQLMRLQITKLATVVVPPSLSSFSLPYLVLHGSLSRGYIPQRSSPCRFVPGAMLGVW